MKMVRFTRRISAVFLCLFFTSCATRYVDHNVGVENSLLANDINQASVEIDNNPFLQKKRNRLLFLLEKAKIEHMLGNYENSNILFEEAYILIDDKINTEVGQAIAAKLTNPMAEPYKGEDFEKVTIHYYKALNFFQMGNVDAALVEAKRINIKLLELNDRYQNNKNKYAEDAFSQILQGILYESTGDVNNAFIAYRNAADLYEANDNVYFGVPIPLQLQKDLLRTSKILGFTEEYNSYKSKFKLQDPSRSGSEAIVFWENGLGPYKDQTIITASGAGNAFVGSVDGETIFIPIPDGINIGINALAIPNYQPRQSYYTGASILTENGEQHFELVEDFYPIAKQCLNDRMLREAIDIALRFAAKKGASKGLGLLAGELLGDTAGELTQLGADAAGAATEKADTRNWQTLPATISYVRVPLEENVDKTLVIKKYGQGASIDYDTLVIPYKKGLQLVNYFDLGKTMKTAAPVEQIEATLTEVPKEETAPAKASTHLAQNSTAVGENAVEENAEETIVSKDVSSEKLAQIVEEGAANTAKIYFIRKWKFVGGGARMPIFCNNEQIFEIKNKRYHSLTLTPGKFSIAFQKNENGEDDPYLLPLDIVEGGTYYVEVNMTAGVGGEIFSLMDEAEAQQCISTFKAND